MSGTSQLGRHLKVCEVKKSMDGVIQQISTSDEVDPNWKFDQEAAKIELVQLVSFLAWFALLVCRVCWFKKKLCIIESLV